MAYNAAQYQPFFDEARKLYPDRGGELDALATWDPATADSFTIPDAANLIPGLRDELAAQRDAYVIPLEQQFRDQRAGSGMATDATSANTMDSPEFRAFAGLPVGTGARPANQQFENLLSTIRGVNAQPGVSPAQVSGATPSPIMVNKGPIENTLEDIMSGQGNDPLDLQGHLSDTLNNGDDPLGLQQILAQLLQRSAGGGMNSDRLENRLNSARDNLAAAETGAMSDVRAILAERGMASMPGSPSGAEMDASIRALDPLQRNYLQEVRQAEFDESVRADESELNAISVATGWDRDRSEKNLNNIMAATGWTKDQAMLRLSAAQSSTDRQQMLSEVALGQLEQNRLWNQFMAEFGLEREQLAEEIQSGRLGNITQLFQLYLGLVNQSRGGYVGDE